MEQYTDLNNIFFTSDLHFGHDRDFVWQKRGFNNVDEMNNAIIKNWNTVVAKDSIVYLLGDVIMGDVVNGAKLLHQLNGQIHIIIGNHDTDKKIQIYQDSYNVVSITTQTNIRLNNTPVLLSHYPIIIFDQAKLGTSRCPLCFFGHTHQTTDLFWDIPTILHVGVDSNNCKPVSGAELMQRANTYAKNFNNSLNQTVINYMNNNNKTII